MPIHTYSQKMAQEAYERVAARHLSKEYVSFAREFPTLIHACGLAQAIAFARAKARRAEEPGATENQGETVETGTNHYGAYLKDLVAVLKAIGHSEVTSTDALAHQTRMLDVPAYVRMSRNALRAAGWLKRYVEAEGAA